MPLKKVPSVSLRNLKLVLEYDGAGFFGFQKQPGKPTVQEILEKAMTRLFNRPMKIASASGRTDAGVHASHQVVNFKVSSPLSLYKIQRGLNFYLPESISVMAVDEVPAGFHARFQAHSKRYEYRVWNAEVRSPLNAKTSYHVMGALNLSRMRAGAKLLTGRHDFRSFCGKREDEDGSSRKSTVRTLYRFQISRSGNMIKFCVEADGFLYHMVRNLVGTLLDLGRGKIDLAALRSILKAKNREKAGMKVPACGLCLVYVSYDR